MWTYKTNASQKKEVDILIKEEVDLWHISEGGRDSSAGWYPPFPNPSLPPPVPIPITAIHHRYFLLTLRPHRRIPTPYSPSRTAECRAILLPSFSSASRPHRVFRGLYFFSLLLPPWRILISHPPICQMFPFAKFVSCYGCAASIGPNKKEVFILATDELWLISLSKL